MIVVKAYVIDVVTHAVSQKHVTIQKSGRLLVMPDYNLAGWDTSKLYEGRDKGLTCKIDNNLVIIPANEVWSIIDWIDNT